MKFQSRDCINFPQCLQEDINFWFPLSILSCNAYSN